MNSVFIAHPGLQHSHQLAWALSERGLLQSYWSGVPVLGAGEVLPFWIPGSYALRMKNTEIPISLKRNLPAFQFPLRIGSFFRSQSSRTDFTHRIFHLFDWWVARQIPRLKPRIVIAYENTSFHTFLAAKSIGAKCILDAPSLHHAVAARILNTKSSPYLAEIDFRKDEEVRLADLILTCSPLAAESYVSVGVPTNKVRPMLLGATLPEGVNARRSHAGPIRFIFAGALRLLKSIDLLLAVFKRLHAEGFVYELLFVGGEGEFGWVQQIEKTPGAQYIHTVPQTELYQKLAQADCLLLPSRFDSFGMVVAEALACGTPAIVSNQTGAKAIIEMFPEAGWIVNCDEESIYRCVKARIENRAELFAARERAVEAAGHFTWQSYRNRVGSLILNWIDQ